MTRVLITGVAGFIGAHVARRFQRDGFQIIGIDDLSTGRRGNVPSGIDFIQGDLADPATLTRCPMDCRLILHLAGQSSGEISFDNPVADLQKNVTSTLNLIRYGLKARAERFVYASSMSVYGAVADGPIAETHPCSPLSCYGVAKLAAEGYLRIFQKELPFVALRMFNVYGPGQDMSNLRQGMVSIYLAQALAGGRIEVKGSVDRFRDFVYIDDVVEAWLSAATHPSAVGKCLNVGTGVRTSVGEILEIICSLIPGSTYFVQGATPGDQSGIYADVTELKRCLRLGQFTTLEKGLRIFSDWAQQSQ